MKKTAFTLLLSLTWLSGFSQPLDMDSLKQALTLARQDKDKVMMRNSSVLTSNKTFYGRQ